MRSFDILVVDDFETFRRFVCSVLQSRREFRFTEALNGLEALQKAEKLQPDLILLDIGLPDMNGLEVARRVRKLAPAAKILFLSQESSPDVVREALSLGALGYVHKPCSKTDLLPAIDAVLEGEQFVGNGLEFGRDAQPPRRHEILFCSDDEAVLEGLTRFIASALSAGNPAIVWAAESHRNCLPERLRKAGVDIDAAVQRGTYIASDVGETADSVRILATLDGLCKAACQGGTKHPRVAVCGERAGRFWAEGKTDAAIKLEQLFNELAKRHEMDILCVYPLPDAKDDRSAFASLCAEHSVVSYR